MVASVAVGGVLVLAVRSNPSVELPAVTVTKTVSAPAAESERQLDIRVAEAAATRTASCYANQVPLSSCGIYRLPPNPHLRVYCGVSGECHQKENGIEVPVYNVTSGEPCTPSATPEAWEATEHLHLEFTCTPAG
jgi:hypothetical protein